jgi:hypothetical protein
MESSKFKEGGADSAPLMPTLPDWYGEFPTAAELEEARSFMRRHGPVHTGYRLAISAAWVKSVDTDPENVQARHDLCDFHFFRERTVQEGATIVREVRDYNNGVYPPIPTISGLLEWTRDRRKKREEAAARVNRPEPARSTARWNDDGISWSYPSTPPNSATRYPNIKFHLPSYRKRAAVVSGAYERNGSLCYDFGNDNDTTAGQVVLAHSW